MNRALLVIDVQREYFEGALPISHPAGHLERILDVMDRAAQAKVPTAVIRHHQADPDSPMFRQDSDMWQLHSEVECRPRDVQTPRLVAARDCQVAFVNRVQIRFISMHKDSVTHS